MTDTLIILSPAFAAREGDSWLPAQESTVRAINRLFPRLRVVILSFHYPEGGPRHYTWFGNDVVAFSGGMRTGLNSILRWKDVWSELRWLKATRKVIGIFSFFCSECAFIGHYFAMRHRLVHRIWVLGQDARKENTQVRRIRPLPEELVCISDFLVEEFNRSHGIRPSHVIPLGIDRSLFGPQPAIRTIDLLGAGSLIPLKQYDQFLAVARTVAGELPGIKALVCGDGPERERLQSLIDGSRLSGQVQLAGLLPHPEVLSVMQRSKVLLHPSSYEGLGAVCLEALYAGAHVISFVRPIRADIPRWHIVDTVDDMAASAISLLRDIPQDTSPVLPFEVHDSARKIMALFGYGPLNAS